MRARAAFLVVLALFAGGCLGARASGSVFHARSPHNPTPGPCGDKDQTSARAEWEKVRLAFPYHLQTIAISPAFGSGCRALIVTEPPPDATVDGIKQVAPALLAGSEIMRHTIGYDGWTQDVVFTIPALSERELRELIADLHSSLFGTTYRMHTVATSARPPVLDPKATPVDITVGPGDLNRWLLEGQGSLFRPLRGGPPIPFRQLLETSEAGLHIDAEHGLVSWIIPRSADIASMRALVRQFAMESDLIVGAIASPRAVAVIARQRIIDPLLLPPLRFETAALLAAVDTRELGQSYERTHFLAGLLADGSDWAPIYLSPELLDTEYGSLLNITDQFLKSWSNSGGTHYINFDYPHPARWPFSIPIHRIIRDSIDPHAAVTYNWNPVHASAAIDLGDVDVFWLRRTGALNVTYLAGDEQSQVSSSGATSLLGDLGERGHEFFAGVQNPLLARVVQYHSLYQIFKRYHLTSSWSTSGRTEKDAADALEWATRRSLLALGKATPAVLSENVDKLVGHESRRTRNFILAFLTSLSEQMRLLSADEFGALVAKLASPRMASDPGSCPSAVHLIAGIPVSPPCTMRDTSLHSLYERLVLAHGLIGGSSGFDVHGSYARSIEPKLGTWIHTPSIVVSWNEKPYAHATGGHNLSAEVQVLRYEPRPLTYTTVPYLRSNDAVSTVGPAELNQVTLGRQGPIVEPTAPLRAPRTALGIKADPPAPSSGWRVADGSGAARAEHDILIAKHGDGYTVTDSARGVRYETTTRAEAVELAGAVQGTRNGKLVVETRNFTPDEARGLSHAMELRAHAKLAGVIESPPPLARETVKLAGAKVGEAEAHALANGTGAIRVTIEVPTATRTLTMRVQAVFKKITPERLRSSATRMEQSAHSFVEGHSIAPAKIEDLGLDLREVIKEVTDGAEFIEVKLQAELADFTISELERSRDAHGTDRHAG